MADFRRWLLAFAVVAVICSLAVPASAQAVSPPLTCIATANVTPTVRAEGYTELMGDLVFVCSGGNPTPAGQAIPQVNLTLFLSANVTSRLTTSTGFSEALLLIDEPHSATHPDRVLLNCGGPGAPDLATNPGVCLMTATRVAGIGGYDPSRTYDPSADTALNRPNTFQGHNTGQPNAITWSGVPFDPPGTVTTRTLRFTNIRADAESTFFSAANGNFVPITASISVTGPTSVAVSGTNQPIAFVARGLPGSGSNVGATFTAKQTFNQCNFPGGTTNATFIEGFQSAFKPRNLKQVFDNQNDATKVTYVYARGSSPIWTATDVNQNVVGAVYNTETGFEWNPSFSSPSPNPPPGIGFTGNVGTDSFALSNSATNINQAGQVDNGTRFMINITSIPNGVGLSVPNVIQMNRTGGATGVSGVVAIVIGADANGAGGTPTTTGTSTTIYSTSSTSGSASVVYEVLFSDPFAIESLVVPITISAKINLATPTPQTGVTAVGNGGFAPNYPSSFSPNPRIALQFPSAGLPIPRFIFTGTNNNLFVFQTCSCNILFPYVTNTPPFDTGVAIANTSKDIYGTGAQFGAVTLFFFATPGGVMTQIGPTQTPVQAGEVLTYTLSGGGGGAGNGGGLGPFPGAFTGYVIAQAQFQYCHAFAFISDLGAQKVAEGYLGLILDDSSLNATRSGQQGESRAH